MEKNEFNYCPLKPEGEYSLRVEPYSNQDFVNFVMKNTTVTGYVERIDTENSELLVRIGENICHLPFDEVTIYPLTYSKNTERTIPIQICTLLHKKIRVKVVYINDSEIFVSRRKNMIEAVSIIKKYKIVYCRVNNLSAKYCFLDIGDGINAILNIREISKCRANSTSEFFHVGDKFSAKILSYDELNRFSVSYKKMYKKYDMNDYIEGDCHVCKVYSPVDEACSGFYVSITPQVSGILDVTSWMPPLKYGDSVEAIVTNANPKGVKMRYVRSVE